MGADWLIQYRPMGSSTGSFWGRPVGVVKMRRVPFGVVYGQKEAAGGGRGREGARGGAENARSSFALRAAAHW